MTGSAAAIVFAENIQRILLRIGHVQCDESFLHQNLGPAR